MRVPAGPCTGELWLLPPPLVTLFPGPPPPCRGCWRMLFAAAVVVVAAGWAGAAGGGKIVESDGLPANDLFNTNSSSAAGCSVTAQGSPVKDCRATFMHHRTQPVLEDEPLPLPLPPEGLEVPPPPMRIGGEPRVLIEIAAAAVAVLGGFFGAWHGAALTAACAALLLLLQPTVELSFAEKAGILLFPQLSMSASALPPAFDEDTVENSSSLVLDLGERWRWCERWL